MYKRLSLLEARGRKGLGTRSERNNATPSPGSCSRHGASLPSELKARANAWRAQDAFIRAWCSTRREVHGNSRGRGPPKGAPRPVSRRWVPSGVSYEDLGRVDGAPAAHSASEMPLIACGAREPPGLWLGRLSFFHAPRTSGTWY